MLVNTNNIDQIQLEANNEDVINNNEVLTNPINIFSTEPVQLNILEDVLNNEKKNCWIDEIIKNYKFINEKTLPVSLLQFSDFIHQNNFDKIKFEKYIEETKENYYIKFHNLTFLYYEIIKDFHLEFHNTFFNLTNVKFGIDCDHCLDYFIKDILKKNGTYDYKYTFKLIAKFNYIAMKKYKNLVCISPKTALIKFKTEINNISDEEINYFHELISSSLIQKQLIN